MTALLKVLALAAFAMPAKPDYGVLLLAHGGSPEWNAEVENIRDALDARVPTELALGMADAGTIQTAADRLASRGVARIVAVPLFINSRSEVMDQTRYVLGLSEKPSETFVKAMEEMAKAMGPHAHHHGGGDFNARLKTAVPVALAPALDDAPEVEAILLDRARALSKEPRRETVFLVGHGPVDDVANDDWLKTMKGLAEAVRKAGGFRGAEAATIRDDSDDAVKTAAAKALRARVYAAAKDGRAIGIPYVVSRGGIEGHIKETLKDLDYAWDGRALCPDSRLVDWAARVAAKTDAAR